MSKHADASPSGSSTWIVCAAAVTQARGKVRKSTPFTREGSAAHQLAEAVLKGEPAPSRGMLITIEGEAIEVTAEMEDAVSTYVAVCEADSDAEAEGVEVRVHLNYEGEDIFGTCDRYSFKTPVLKVKDFKYGQGVPVSPNSSQLKIYALGVINELGPFADIEQIELTICQPRNGGTTTHTLSYAELIEWETTVLLPAVARLAANDPTEVAGDHCRWCVRAGECRAFAALATSKAKVAFGTIPPDPTTLTDQELGEILEHAETISAWVTKVRAEVSARIDNGAKVPGWKLVAKRAVRKFADEVGALSTILQRGVPWDEITRIETLGTVEKVLKKHGVKPDVLDPYLVKESSGSTLVPEDSPREAIATDAKTVFS
jgi:hypothetical protein